MILVAAWKHELTRFANSCHEEIVVFSVLSLIPYVIAACASHAELAFEVPLLKQRHLVFSAVRVHVLSKLSKGPGGDPRFTAFVLVIGLIPAVFQCVSLVAMNCSNEP